MKYHIFVELEQISGPIMGKAKGGYQYHTYVDDLEQLNKFIETSEKNVLDGFKYNWIIIQGDKLERQVTVIVEEVKTTKEVKTFGKFI